MMEETLDVREEISPIAEAIGLGTLDRTVRRVERIERTASTRALGVGLVLIGAAAFAFIKVKGA